MSTRFGLFQDLSDVTLGDLAFNTVDDLGCVWTISDIDGWWGIPEPTVPDDTRPFSQDGSYLTTGRYGPRAITLSGTCTPPQDNINAIVAARARFQRACNLVRKTATFTVNELDGARMSEVQIAGRPLTKIEKLNGEMTFEVVLRAVDPRKYSTNLLQVSTGLPSLAGGFSFPLTFPLTFGDTKGSSGIASANNEGSYETSAIIRFDGPIQAPAVEHLETGKILSFTTNLGESDSLYLDLNERSVTLNGQESRRGAMLSGSRWFLLSPGMNSLRFRSDNPFYSIDPLAVQPRMTVLYRQAWID